MQLIYRRSFAVFPSPGYVFTKLFLILSLLLLPVLASAFDGYIDIKNETGYDVYYVYVSPGNSDSWEEDVLGDDILVDGEEVRITLEGYKSSIFDVRLVDEDEDTYTFYGIDVALEDLTVTLDDMDVDSDSDGFEGYVEVTNDTGYDIYYLYVSHDDSASWEEDVLGDDILESGETIRVDVSGYPDSIFDIKAEDEDGDTYTRYNVDIAAQDLTLTLDDLD